MGERLCVVMPVYNEQEAIGPVLEKWAHALDALGVDYVIRPYNDGSKDDSLVVMREVAGRLPRVDVHDKPNGGHGNTILTGYREAVRDGFDWVFQIDSDDEMGPEKFGELWAKRNDYDFLVGIRDGRVQQLPRKVISFVSRMCVRLFYGKSVWDVNTPYRLMRVLAFEDFYQAIPLTTFAPNVILSGLAARYKLRCYEIRVPQHDRTTGEVSIKKWKLLKAAAKSFRQTILFSQSRRSGSTGGLIGFLLAVVFSAGIIATLNYTSFAWCDEAGTSDTAINCVLRGEWVSHVWQYSYNPLHIHLLTGWLHVFGVSHLAVCSLGVVGALVLCTLLQFILIRRGILNSISLNILYQIMFWFGSWTFSTVITQGRIDLFVAIFTVLLVVNLMVEASSGKHLLEVFAFGFLMMMAAVYPVPVVVCFGVLLLLCAKGGRCRIGVLKTGMAAAAGVGLAFLLSCVYYGYHRHLFRFVHSYFSFNATISDSSLGLAARIIRGYGFEVTGLVLLGFVLLYSVLKRKQVSFPFVIFLTLIPFFGVIGGRYEMYYSWMFYLPVLSAFLFAVSRIGSQKLVWALIVVFGVVGTGRYWAKQDEWAANRRVVERVEDCVTQHPEIFNSSNQVVITDYLFYYPVVRSGAIVFADDSLTGYRVSPREKFDRFVAAHVRDGRWRSRLVELFDKYEEQPIAARNGSFRCVLNKNGNVDILRME